MALVTYESQVDFARRWIKAGVITSEGSTWRQGAAWGKLWSGIVCGYSVRLQTIGDGPMMRPGSFRVRAITKMNSGDFDGL